MYQYIQYPNTSGIEECQRLFHGRGNAYPGFSHLNIDWLAPVVLITFYQEVEQEWLASLAQELKQKLPECRSIQAQYRSRPKAPVEVVWGEAIEALTVTENGLEYGLQLGRSQNSGLFLDIKNGRHWVRQNAKGKNILNLFAYTCGFSVAAVAGGAKQVVNVDMSKSALARGRENHRLNQHDLSKVKFEGVDIFKSYSRLRKHGPYEMLISDPPLFQKGSVDIRRDYIKIIRRIPELVVPGGDVLLCLNAPELDEQFLFDQVEQACPVCHFVQAIKPPAVFVEAEKGKGLKVLHFRYMPL